MAWEAMLKLTDVRLELLKDIDMHLFFERDIRGGLSQCSVGYSAANNKYMNEGYDPSKPDKFLMYFDINNLYGAAMMQSLPCSDFELVNPSRLDTVKWNVNDNDPVECKLGYILAVDLEYTDELHGVHADLPFCPELLNPPGSKQSKLLATLLPKKKYVIHYRNLRQALQHGLKLVKIHRILQFRQEPWLKKYIDLNTEYRKKATNDFGKNFFKLMNNSVFGKTMENVRRRRPVKLVTEWDGRSGAEALIARPNFHSCTIFDTNLVALELGCTDLLLNKPIYAGFCVLNISKTLVYNFHYDIMHRIVNPNYVQLMYTDTDSLGYDVTHTNMYELMKQNPQYFDTSDYPENNRFGLALSNKKVIGLMKDECAGRVITEFVGLRLKCIRPEWKAQVS